MACTSYDRSRLQWEGLGWEEGRGWGGGEYIGCGGGGMGFRGVWRPVECDDDLQSAIAKSDTYSLIMSSTCVE